jgi:site-specific DNA recombinase
VVEIFTRYGRGEGLRTIAKTLNARGVPSARAGKRGTGSWAPSALFSLLRRPRSIGILEWNHFEKTYRRGTKVRVKREEHEWLRIEAPHLRIVSDELWTAAQAQMRKNKVGIPTTGAKKKGGRPHSYLLSGLARCASCGGALTVLNSRDGMLPIKVYVCGYRRDRGETVCANKMRRPVERVDDAVVAWIQANISSEELVLDSLEKVRQRLVARAKTTGTGEVPQLEGRAAKLRAELGNLVDILASTPKANAGSILAGISERQEELNDLETRIRTTKAAPEAIQFEVRRMEAEAKRLIADLGAAAAMEPSRARAFLSTLFDGTLTARPVETEDGPRVQIEGTASVARMLAAETSGGRTNPPRKFASPTGFEPVLAA